MEAGGGNGSQDNGAPAAASKSPPENDPSQDVQKELQALKKKLEDETRLRQYTEQVLDSRQLELELAESKLEALRAELSEAHDQVTQAKGRSKSKEKQLSEAKDQIFRLQPQRKDVNEADAIDAYRLLCANVHRWVENRMKGILDELDGGRLRARPAPPQAVRFVSMMRETAKRGLALDQSDVYHVVAIIMNYLCMVFFSKSFYCPLDDYEGDATLTFIDELEASMARLPRDPAHCREWRSETLAAMTSQKSFKTRRIRFIVLVTEDLATILSTIAPKVPTAELQSSIRRSIIEPAADLAHDLHVASSIYSLKWPARGAWSRLEVYECLDLANGGEVLNLSGTVPSSSIRRNVAYLFDVSPGLFVERVVSGKKSPLKAICRPSVLVHSGGGGVQQSPTVMNWLWESAASLPGPSQNNPQRAATPSTPRKSTGSNQPSRRR
ncbi:unnamed protein product [Clonostachys rosea]|uniref:Uncharacterized protein n=1 Tax=Bionectria ochroleuca TaxID=29856 RepID=A0ABY6U3J7_BIOOC|nr:unnamed protein product [Clonostachys rosea]